MRLLAAVVAAVLLPVVADAAETKGAAQAVSSGAGSIVIGSLSVPVLSARKVRMYESAVVGLKVANANQYLKQVCDLRFEIVDGFLTHLHSKPFSTSSEVDGVRGQQEMLVLAKQVGGDFITGLDLSWSRTPRPIDNTVFGNNQAVPCRSN
ncbi:MAG: hypothetical protein FJX64_08410 [Alphaproteobacteria bacterium]|nr:hypothetical protein [Alphaproteobacteria bacterium]